MTIRGLPLESPFNMGTFPPQAEPLAWEQQNLVTRWQCQMETKHTDIPQSYPLPMDESGVVYAGLGSAGNHGFPMTEGARVERARLMRTERLMAIGNDISVRFGDGAGRWHCLYENTSPPLAPRLGRTCSGRFDSAEATVAHFRTAHHPIRLHEPPIWYKCKKCAQWNNVQDYCLQCGVVEKEGQEQWIQAYTFL